MDSIRWAVADWWDEFGEFVIVIALVFAAIIGLSFGAVYGISRPSCYASFRDSGFDVRWSFLGGCQIKTEDRWIPAEAYRVTRNQ